MFSVFQGIDGETAKDFCWIHGSAYIPPEYQQHMRCIADHTGVERKEDAPARIIIVRIDVLLELAQVMAKLT